MPLDPITMGLLIGAGAGLLKSEAIDRPKENRDRKLRAAEQRYSPWTNLQQFTKPEAADPLGGALQFGATGAAMGQGVQNQEFQNQFNQQLLKNMKGGAMPPISPWSLNSNSFWSRPTY